MNLSETLVIWWYSSGSCVTVVENELGVGNKK